LLIFSVDLVTIKKFKNLKNYFADFSEKIIFNCLDFLGKIGFLCYPNPIIAGGERV
jgi:hypothetical protein